MMHEPVFEELKAWFGGGQTAALAIVIQTWGSSPRPAGSLMAVSQSGQIAGSVSGGCVEGAVIDAALEVLQSGKPARLHFGVADDQAWEVGLACGGEIEVFVRKFREENWNNWQQAFESQKAFNSILVLSGDNQGGEVIQLEGGDLLTADGDVDRVPELVELIKNLPERAKTSPGVISLPGGREIFYLTILPPPLLVLVGGGHIAIPLVQLARIVGFETVVIDPRRLFGSLERFPEPGQLIPEWPQSAFQKITVTESTGVVMLTHDPKIDDPALLIALKSPAFYVGALGSQKTHRERLRRLSLAGLDDGELHRIHAPVGLDLGGKIPEEIALAIMAEVIQAWNKKQGAP